MERFAKNGCSFDHVSQEQLTILEQREKTAHFQTKPTAEAAEEDVSIQKRKFARSSNTSHMKSFTISVGIHLNGRRVDIGKGEYNYSCSCPTQAGRIQ